MAEKTTNGVVLPATAGQAGGANAVEVTEEKSVRLSHKGPKVGERGEYLPCAYKTRSGNIREDR
jgi:hypothetical protein